MSGDKSQDQILTQRSGQVAHIIFNNPARHNAMTLFMWQRLAELMKDLAVDDDVRVVVLSGAGDKAFVSGADISQFGAERANPDSVANYDRLVAAADKAVAGFPKPTIAKINGYCFGGGLGLALGCDIRLSAETAKFALPAAQLGLGYSYDGTIKLINAVGPANAAEIFYTADTYDAGDALRIGLVNRVTPDDELDDVVDELAHRIATNAPLTQQTFKAAMKECLKSHGETDPDYIQEMAKACFASADYIEGRQAFMEKRKPVFKGK